MRVAWISHSSSLAGGAEKSLVEAIEALDDAETEQYLVIPRAGQLELVVKDQILGFKTVSHPWWVKEYVPTKNPIKRLAQYVKSTLQIFFWLRTIKADVVITNTLVAPCGAIAAKLAQIPHVWYIHELMATEHGLHFEFERKRTLSFVRNLSAQVIANSKVVHDRFLPAVGGSKLNTIYYSVEDSGEMHKYDLLPSADEYFHLVLVGRLCKGKGQREAVEALRILRRKSVKAHLWLVGGAIGAYPDELRNLAKELGVEDALSFIKHVSNPYDYMLSADAVLMCSREEAFGRVTVEAMKVGKPVIAANSGSAPELVRHGWNGLLYESGSPESLAEQIEVLVKSRSLAREMGRNAYSWAHATFNKERYRSELTDVIRSCFEVQNQ